MTQDTLYLKINPNVLTHQNSLMVKDAAEIVCSDKKLENRINVMKLQSMHLPKPGRYVKSALEVIRDIQEEFPQLEIQNLGEVDFLVTYEKEQKKNEALVWAKTVCVSIVSFFGAAFSIMTFNNDVDVPGLFSQVYMLFTGQTSDGFTVLELSYSVGLGLGIILFFNHLAGKKIQTDPTPLEVQMHTYEDDVNQTIIASGGTEKSDGKGRQG